MRIRLAHHWKRYEGLFVLTVLAFASGNETVSVTLFNFAIELEF